METKYTDYAVDKVTGEIFMCDFDGWPSSNCALVTCRSGYGGIISKSKLIRIPYQFKAYVKSDSDYHCLSGETVFLKFNHSHFFDEYESDNHCLCFVAEGPLYVCNGDIDFTTIETIEPNATMVIPPMPPLEELEKCSIVYEGRKTLLTYCDYFVGEAICHEDDEFNVNIGIAIAYDRAKKSKEKFDEQNKIKIGDIVVVEDTGENYSVAITKVIEICKKIDNLSACARYVYDEYLEKSKDRFDKFRVLYVDKHFAYIENIINLKCRLINVTGISKVKEEKEDFSW